MFYEYVTSSRFKHGTESVNVELNRINKTFRLIMDDSSAPKDLEWFSLYKNGNLKTLECMFHFLNNVFGKRSNLKSWIYMPDEIDRDGISCMYNESWIEYYNLLDLYKAFVRNCNPFKDNTYHAFEDSSGIIKIEKWN